MANTTDNSGKGAKPSVDPKRPTAVIDVKPTGVEIKNPAEDPPRDRNPGSDPAKAASTVAAAAARAADQARPADKASQATSSQSAPAPSSGAVPRSAAPPSGGGLRAAATHLVAGIAGGLLALLAADTLLPKTDHPASESARLAGELDSRLRAVEQAAANPAAAAELGRRLASAEQRLVEIDRVAKATAQDQSRLAGESKATAERLAALPTAAAPAEERLGRLEEILNTLAAGAKDDQQRGRIQQLAAIAGKLTDLEQSVSTQMAQLRKSVTQEVDSRLAQSSDAAQAARAGAQRLDRELAGVKTEAAQLGSRIDGLQAQSDRLDVGMKAIREEAAALKSDIAVVRDDLRQVARPKDVSSALSPVASKLAALEQNVQGVVRGEDDRRANVERIVTALELGNLKRTIDRGAPFAAELAEVRRVAGTKLDLSMLERYRDKGVQSLAELERDFRTLAFSIIDADRQPANAHWTDRLIASARSVVRVRKVDQSADDQSAEAVAARMEQALKSGRLADVVTQAAALSPAARAAAAPWLERVEARAAVDRAIAAIEQDLKASLGATSPSGKKG